MVDCQKVEGRHADNREREGNGRESNSASVLTASERKAHDRGTEHVIYNKTLWISNQHQLYEVVLLICLVDLHSILSGLA